jgi:hypothetical protein
MKAIPYYNPNKKKEAMPTINELWDKLPKFMKNHMTVRTTLRHSDDSYEGEPWTDQPINKANLITSKVDRYPYGVEYHRPVLDIDFEAELIPSSTPGHYHLYLDKQLPKQAYFNLLRSLADAGIIQHGFADSAIGRGATSARLPWIKKDDWAANQADPDAEVKTLKAKLLAYEQETARIRVQLEKIKDIW